MFTPLKMEYVHIVDAYHWSRAQLDAERCKDTRVATQLRQGQ